jgi:hypothetical protein
MTMRSDDLINLIVAERQRLEACVTALIEQLRQGRNDVQSPPGQRTDIAVATHNDVRPDAQYMPVSGAHCLRRKRASGAQ